MSLKIRVSVYEEMVRSAEDAIPLEACGLLAGENGTATKFYPLTNADASAVHFSMVPAEQFAAVKDMRSQGLRMLGIWHSHPSTPPRMSEEDLKLALDPNAAYLILSLAVPGQPKMCGFEMRDGEAKEIPVTISND